MEALAGAGSPKTRQRGLWIVLALVVLLRLPFLYQAISGDDDIYLTEGAHALVDPLHPDNTRYVFRGVEVDLRGQPHPPLDAWALGGLLAVFGAVKELPFHAAYIVFSLIAASAMWSLALRFSPQPVWAALLFVGVPAFIVNGNLLETDLPFLAFWMASIALFCSGRLALAAIAMIVAATGAAQAVFLTPILAVYVWLYRRRNRLAWLVILVPPAAFAGWQLFEYFSTGALPAAVLSGYLKEYDVLRLKLWNALSLLIDSWFLIFPALLPAAAIIAWRHRREPQILFLLAWIGIFFTCAMIAVPTGSARYLLPMAAPLALLASRLRPRWLAIGFAAQLALGLGLAAVNYQHWDGYRQFAQSVRAQTAGHRVWVNGEWGLRYYFEAQGALPLTRSQLVQPGEFVVSSQLGHSVDVTAPATIVATSTIQPAVPLRLIGLDSHSGYSTSSKGLWPFGISAGPIDRITLALAGERHVTLQFLPMKAPEAAQQIVSGIYSLEGGSRWMSHSGVVVLKSPPTAAPLRAVLYIPDNSPVRRVSLWLDGREVASQTYSAPGPYTLESPPVQPGGTTATVQIDVDKTFTAPGDKRELGIVLTAVGW